MSKMESIIPTTRVPATDEVIDAIADIEMQRRETEKGAGRLMSCSAALHRLTQLLNHETEAQRLRGPAAGHSENVDALTAEIARVKGLAGGGPGRGPAPNSGYAASRKATWRDGSRGPARNKGRRTMGRAGGRG